MYQITCLFSDYKYYPNDDFKTKRELIYYLYCFEAGNWHFIVFVGIGQISFSCILLQIKHTVWQLRICSLS